MNPQQPQPDWKAEAQFWQVKYFELLGHSQQVITQLSRSFLVETMQAQAAQFAARFAAGLGIQVPPEANPFVPQQNNPPKPTGEKPPF